MNRTRNKTGFNQNIQFVLQKINSLKKQETKIPVELCFYIIRKKMMPLFKVYILLKMTCCGKCRLNYEDKLNYSEFCGYETVRSFNNQLRNLINLNWIGYNQKSGIYHIRSFGYIQRQQHLYKRTGFWFSIQNMQHFDGVIYSAVIGYLSKSQGKKRRTDQEKGRSRQVLCKSPGFFPISNYALSKILNISISTGSLMKRRAEEVNGIYIKRKKIIAPATPEVYQKLQTSYPSYFFSPIIWKGKLFQRFPDCVKANMKYGTRKKIDK